MRNTPTNFNLNHNQPFVISSVSLLFFILFFFFSTFEAKSWTSCFGLVLKGINSSVFVGADSGFWVQTLGQWSFPLQCFFLF